VTQQSRDPLIAMIDSQRSELESRILRPTVAYYGSIIVLTPEFEQLLAVRVTEGLDFVKSWLQAFSPEESRSYFAMMLEQTRAEGIGIAQAMQVTELVTNVIIAMAREKLLASEREDAVRRLSNGALYGKTMLTSEMARQRKSGALTETGVAADEVED